MKKLILIIATLLLSSKAYGNETLDALKKSDLYPVEYWITSDYNPDKGRSWQYGEISNGFKWKNTKKPAPFMPDEYILQWDYNPDKERAWQCNEITGGVKWKLK